MAQELLAEALAEGEEVRLKIRGGCMQPLLKDGDWVRVAPAAYGHLLPGIIVLARSTRGEALVCHRLLRFVDNGLEPNGLELAGDRTFAFEVHSPEQILGVVHSAERGGRRLQLSTPGWRRFGSFLARWQRASHGLRTVPLGRPMEALRQRFLRGVHRLSWRWRSQQVKTS